LALNFVKFLSSEMLNENKDDKLRWALKEIEQYSRDTSTSTKTIVDVAANTTIDGFAELCFSFFLILSIE
jgi:hypothetical protein